MDANTPNELIELERRFWQAIQDHDPATAMELSDDACLVTGPRGVRSISRSELGKMMIRSTTTLDGFTLDDFEVRMLGDDVAVVAYRVHEDLTVDGETISFDAADASTWVHKDGHWVCAQHSEAIAGDPYGRDRVAARTGPQG